MKRKYLIAGVLAALMTAEGPLKAEVIADQSRIWAPAPTWTGLDKISLPGKPPFVL